jgi:hypothetical protein
MFALAYMGRKRWAQPLQRFCFLLGGQRLLVRARALVHGGNALQNLERQGVARQPGRDTPVVLTVRS